MAMHKHNTIRNKITISYFILVLLAAAAIGVLYKGINNIVLLDANSTKPNQKLKYINKILTQVYEAESFSRSYFLFRNDSILKIYIQANNNISLGIDSLKNHCSNNAKQITDLDNIIALLDQKKNIINALLELNQGNQQEILYTRVLDEVYFNTYEDLNQPSIIRQNVTTKRDSVFDVKEKTGLFNKVKKIFKSDQPTSEKTLTKTSIEQAITYDTIASSNPSNQQVLKTVKKALENFKVRSEFLKQQYISKETELLHSDRIILDRIRNIISSLETEEILNTTILLATSQKILKEANNSVIMLGGLAVLLVFVFLFIIFRDISRTRAYQSELQKAQKYSQDLLQLKEQFVANMSHEIRTPLSAIIGFSEQLIKTSTSPDQEMFIHNIEQSSKHLHTLINNVLDLSKSNAGKLALDEIPFNLNELIIETYHTFSNDAKNKDLQFSYFCDTTTESGILGDKLKVKQVLINIIGNAIKFTDSGMVDLVAYMKTLDEETVEAEIIIFDTGIGIPPEKIQYIFEEFSQADSEINRKFGGSGLGLSISKRLVDLMHGSIEVNSVIGQGSTFIIHVPFKKYFDALPEEKPENSNFEVLKDLKILVVEDDETMRLLLLHIFKNYHIETDFATTGIQALEKLSEKEFHLVLSDIQMPGMSGIELVQTIRKNFTHPLPVIAFTAHSSVSADAYNAGFNGFLAKPFTEKEIMTKISETLGLSIIDSEKQPENQILQEVPSSNGYSFSFIKEFVGTDEEAFNQILNTFITNTTSDLELLKKYSKKKNIEGIAEKIHKLLPMFRQLQINKLIDEMLMIERYKELNLTTEDIILFTENFIKHAKKIIARLKKEIPAATSEVNTLDLEPRA